MDSYETPFDAKSWGSLEKQLAPKSGSGSNAAWLVALVAATVFTGVASYVVYNHSFRVSTARGGHNVARFNQTPISPELKSTLIYAEENSV